jgi:XapX domain-containing protein
VRITQHGKNKEEVMIAYLVSLMMGLAVGAAYGLIEVRSPAPPLVALIGLLGMVLGERAIDTAKIYLAPPAIQQPHDDVPNLR